MKLDDINLNNIKVAIFDFDDTLAIHKDKDFCKHRRESECRKVDIDECFGGRTYINCYLQSADYPSPNYGNL